MKDLTLAIKGQIQIFVHLLALIPSIRFTTIEMVKISEIYRRRRNRRKNEINNDEHEHEHEYEDMKRKKMKMKKKKKRRRRGARIKYYENSQKLKYIH